MNSLGIVSGSFDFIVTEDGEHVFLEVNEQGQFLWLEDLCPDLLLLDAFCAFLTSGDKNFAWKVRRGSIRLRSVQQTQTYINALAEDQSAFQKP